MDKKIIIIIGIIILLFYATPKKEAVTGDEVMERSSSADTVFAGDTFDLTYTVTGASGTWGASIVDSVSGGCTFPSGNPDYQTVMLSEDGLTKTITINSPATDATCTFVGDYKFGDLPIVLFDDLSVQITTCVPDCVRPADLCLAESDDGCGGICSWTVVQLTDADTNCDGQIDRTELGVAIMNWIDGTFTRTDLGIAIQSWAGG